MRQDLRKSVSILPEREEKILSFGSDFSSYKTWHTQSSGTDNFGDFQGSNPISSSTLFETMLDMFSV